MVTVVNSSLWGFACDVYAESGVQQACLRLQDSDHIDVPLLLFCCWSGLRYGAVSKQQLQQAASFSNEYTHISTSSLRTLRRQMKTGYSDHWPISEQAWCVLREQVKSVELESERLILQGLEYLMSDNALRSGVKDDCIANINHCFCGLDIATKPLELILISACDVYKRY